MAKDKTIIIHSKVASGYVGSNTSALILQQNGHDVITIPTVIYSNHLNLPTFGGGQVPDLLFAAILKGILELNVLNEVSTIITGYIGSKEQVKITADFIQTIKKQKPEILYLCDPVMGDIGKGQYVGAEIPDTIIEQLLPLADVLTPNHFEIERILNSKINTSEAIIRKLEKRFDLSRQKIVITSFNYDTSDKDYIYQCVVEDVKYEVIKTPKANLYPAGTGELFTAHLYLSMLNGINFLDAAQIAGDAVSGVLLKMSEENRKEFELMDILYSLHNVKMNEHK